MTLRNTLKKTLQLYHQNNSRGKTILISVSAKKIEKTARLVLALYRHVTDRLLTRY